MLTAAEIEEGDDMANPIETGARLEQQRDDWFNEAHEQRARAIKAEQQRDELYRALVGSDPDDSNFRWLTAMVSHLETMIEENPIVKAAWEGDDPSAAWECMHEVEKLIAKCRVAINNIEREQNNAVRNPAQD